MTLPRFFVSGIYDLGDRPELEASDVRKAYVVLRKRDGDEVEIVDSSGRSYAARLNFENDGVRAFAIVESQRRAAVVPSLRITLAQAIPKGQKMDYVVGKATELGVERVIAFASERTIGAGVRDGKVERWTRVARSAAMQCGRNDVPEIVGPLEICELIERVRTATRTLVAWEVADARPLRERLPELLAGISEVLLVIGPEGGLTHGEVGDLSAAGAAVVSLGHRILRTETAGLVACSALRYAAGDL
jgi:16S rRNA (uracil1498-N3)-methyltransferase